MTVNIIANTSSPEFTVDPDNIKLWDNNGNPIKNNTTIRLSARPSRLKRVALTLVRVAGEVENGDCNNHRQEIPDSTFGIQTLGQSTTSITLTMPGRYYLYGTSAHNRALFDDPCDPVIIEEVIHV